MVVAVTGDVVTGWATVGSGPFTVLLHGLAEQTTGAGFAVVVPYARRPPNTPTVTKAAAVNALSPLRSLSVRMPVRPSGRARPAAAVSDAAVAELFGSPLIAGGMCRSSNKS